MAPSHLLCLYCSRPAFAVIDVELAQGRGRWPTCSDLDCTGRALNDAGVRLANAANQHIIATAQRYPDDLMDRARTATAKAMGEVIDVDGTDAPTESVLSIEQIREAER